MSAVNQQITRNARVLTTQANVSGVYPASFGFRTERLFFERPFVTKQLASERLNKPVALVVRARDCISFSVDGAPQMLTSLIPTLNWPYFRYWCRSWS